MNKVKEVLTRGARKGLDKIKEKGKAAHARFRKRFPKKEPKYYDGNRHTLKFIIKMGIGAFLIYLYIEEFARIKTNIFGGFMFLIQHPIIFFYNWLLIFATMSLVFLFKKRNFVYMIISLVWILIGTANGVILLKRMTPFTLYDMQNTKDGLSLLSTYVPKIVITIGFTAIGIVVAMLILYLISCPKWENISYKGSIIYIICMFGLAFGSTIGLIKVGVLSTFFGNLNYAYNDYGVPYCFVSTSLNQGIRKPADYSQEEIENILNTSTKNGTNQVLEQKNDNQKYPNIIILQMESFTTAQDYKNLEVSTDPTPNFTRIMKDYSSGTFTVPACGAGTANTEFEVLTGISSKFFGPGEYPYKGKLRKQALDSLGYVLKNHGYSTNAMHDHRAVFYNRNEVYANLGFDTFTSVEYMNNVQKTPTGWCKDKVMTDDIMDIINNSSEQRDLLHIISVEGHGAYPTEQVFKDPYTTVTMKNKNEEVKWQYEYYFNEMYEMDKFIGDLTQKLEESGEPTVLLIYGDHIPAITVTEKDYGDGDLYKTRYAIWDNIGLKKNDENLTAYEVTAKILEEVGLGHEGVIFDYEQTADKSAPDYLDNLKALSYDMLYGKNYVYGGTNPFKRINMKMGYKDIKIRDIIKIGDDYYIRGENFTEHSSISKDGKVLKTVYLSPTLLGLQEKVDPEEVGELKVSQIDTKDDTILTTAGEQEEL